MRIKQRNYDGMANDAEGGGGASGGKENKIVLCVIIVPVLLRGFFFYKYKKQKHKGVEGVKSWNPCPMPGGRCVDEPVRHGFSLRTY